MALWSGTISFGLVAVPVQMLPAVRSHRSALRMLHDADHAPLQRKMLCPQENVFVHPEHIVRGFEIEPGKHVVVRESELEDLEPTRSKTIEIDSFVDLAEVDPVYFERPYYLMPTGAEKPYRLLVEALAATNRVGIAKFVLHDREHLVGIRSIGGALCLLMMHFADEIRPADEIAPAEGEAEAEDVKAVAAAIEKLAGPFEPDRYGDDYQKRVEKLVARKRKKQGTVKSPVAAEAASDEEEAAAAGEAPDLLAVLEQSLAESRRKRGG